MQVRAVPEVPVQLRICAARATTLFAALSFTILPINHASPVPSSAQAAVAALPPVVTGSADRSIRTWDAAGKPLLNFLGHDGAVTAIVLSSDGKRVLSAGADKAVKFWN